jgi:diadenylate cyclase
MNELLQRVSHWLNVWTPTIVRVTLEVLIIFAIVYAFLRVMEGTRGAGVLKGLAFFVAILAVLSIVVTRAWWIQLDTVHWVFTSFMPVIIVPLIILFQPEIRRGLIRLGQNPLFRVFFRPHSRFTEELVKATFSLSRDKLGGLIAIEREVGLRGYVEAGVRLDAEVSAELIKTVFWPGTPLHDGAIVISQQRIAAAGCLFPLTENPQFSKEMGTRHRAGIGITEESDAAAIIISEQTGRVSLAVGGSLQRDLDEKSLRRALEELAAEADIKE